MADPFWIYRPLLDLIGKAEGTDPPPASRRGYNETLAYGAYTDGPVNLVGMTLDEVDALQTAMLRHPRNTWNSSAVGRYQIVRTTLRSIRDRLGLRGNQRFDAAMQDRCACYLLGVRGVDRMLDGRITEDALIEQLAREWASFPTLSGRGYYSGQNAGTTLSAVRAALVAVRHRAKQTPPKGVPEMPGSSPNRPDGDQSYAVGNFVFIVVAIAAAVAVAHFVFGFDIRELF